MLAISSSSQLSAVNSCDGDSHLFRATAAEKEAVPIAARRPVVFEGRLRWADYVMAPASRLLTAENAEGAKLKFLSDLCGLRGKSSWGGHVAITAYSAPD